MALGPYLVGLRPQLASGILYSGDHYWRNLTLARLGNLPFLVLACSVIYLWACRWFSRATGLFAVLLFVNLPPILGHAGLATLDMACAASMITALYQFVRWLETRTSRRAVALGLATGLAILCKFSSLLFLPACFVVASVYLHFSGRAAFIVQNGPNRRLVQASTAVGAALILIWAGYHFSLTPWSKTRGEHTAVESRFKDSPSLGNAVNAAIELRLPLLEVPKGAFYLYQDNKSGYDSYLLGEYRTKGWWYFFPVVLAVKTPIGFLALALGGALAILWKIKSGPWQHCATALFGIAILAACLPSSINLGVRHILPLYPLMALLAGHAVQLFFQSGRWMRFAIVPTLLAGSVVADSVTAHPDYLAYFNQFAGSHPEGILCESDLDWGQDLNRLSLRLKALGIKQVAIRYFGSALLEKAGLPQYTTASSDERTTGYVAVSVRYLRLENAKNGAFQWLQNYRPLERVGKSIYLYYVAN
jgi:4-amino-4-deoxy-L-arabinose transferase-like glycosyltransferase